MLRVFCSLLVLLVCAFGPALAAGEKDDIIYDQVRQKLAMDREVGGNAIDVKVDKGHVTLSGSVRSERQKSRAEKIAKKVKGVEEVENQLVIAP